MQRSIPETRCITIKKRVAVVTYSARAASFYRWQLHDLFGDILEVDVYSFDNNTVRDINADLVMVSTNDIYSACQKHIRQGSRVILNNITLTNIGLEKLRRIPEGQKVMLVNLSAEMAMETIALIYRLGINHLELVPVYPGMEEQPPLDIAVTPGESRFVPVHAVQVIDIGARVLDMSTVVDIAVNLDLDHLLQGEKIRSYFKEIATNSPGVENLLGKTDRLEKQFDILLQLLDDGIIGVNTKGLIYFYNDAAENITGLKRGNVLGRYIWELMPQFPYRQVLDTALPIKGKLIKINGVDIVISVHPLMNLDEKHGVVGTLRKFSDTEKQQHKLRAQVIGKGHVAKYTFEHIIGESPVIKNLKDIACRMADSDSSVLITGESGTGKELFAQAIHNQSRRRDFPFIAVNCAAIPESLLESELFGYEEGAFTGAKKGGKLGLFEMAHQGTLFLDEISEMAPNLQARLLRVLQEKEVMRIGGDSIINVDVRIIAVTNRDMKELVQRGQFRKDLYFRLNILPLTIAPLRERLEDIPLLIDHMSKVLQVEFTLTPEAQKAFYRHSWEGNVRELRNYVEYLGQLQKKLIEAEDLPFGDEIRSAVSDLTWEERENIEKVIRKIGNNKSSCLFVLEELERSHNNRTRTGRRSIAQAAAQRGYFISEQEIRSIFLRLESYGMIEIARGRGGTKLTMSGLKLIRHLKKG